MTQVLSPPLLDTPPEEAFDRLTRLAARLLGAPVALVSLLGMIGSSSRAPSA